MAERYPAAERDALVARIRTERSHVEAVFELFVHEWCLRAGMRVVAVEPAVPGTGRRPDFLVEANGTPFYLECAVARGESDADAAVRSRREDVLRAIDAINSPDFLLGVEVEGAPENPVRVRALTDRIVRWLGGLDHAAIAAAHPDEVPLYEDHLEGMLLSLRPIARQGTRGDGAGRATGILSDGIRTAAPWVTIREPLIRKAGHYGTPELPLVVALNMLDRDARLEHAIEGLYGTEAWEEYMHGGGRPIRLPDGVWNGPRGPQCTRLSAVLIADRLGPWTLGQRNAMFVENLWAARSAHVIDFRVMAWRRDGESLRRQDGISLQEIFDVPAGWPERGGAPTDP
ncbi:hypothetical protein [Microvirga sp. Mcv34]|uniref:hypothetical protein n=1 Tax=Microvirga sp. Mcv34 TaxID=2926016 RepID=UPI0021C62FF7|nr:hypothetical protein [Microvirga sp. Mcv34]